MHYAGPVLCSSPKRSSSAARGSHPSRRPSTGETSSGTTVTPCIARPTAKSLGSGSSFGQAQQPAAVDDVKPYPGRAGWLYSPRSLRQRSLSSRSSRHCVASRRSWRRRSAPPVQAVNRLMTTAALTGVTALYRYAEEKVNNYQLIQDGKICVIYWVLLFRRQ